MRFSPVPAVALVAAVLATSLGTGPAFAQNEPPPPVSTPDTSSCPYRSVPPPPVDLSEVPLPGEPVPEPVPLPDEPVGGERLGECGTVLPDDAPPLPDGITATSWLVADLDTGEVLAAKDPHARHRPASTIKLLTALVAGKKLAPDRVVTGTQSDADTEGSSAGIGPGGRYTVAQLFAGLLLSSGNDAAHALAREMGGVPATLEAMNDAARELGALDTRAASVSGLDAAGMSTSAYDMALVLRAVLEQPGFAQLLRTPQVPFPGYGGRPGYVISNDNRLLGDYPGFLGGKTGFTDDARHTYLGAAERDGRRLVAVVMRAEQRPIRTSEQAARLLDYGFALGSGEPVGRLVDGPPEPATPSLTTPLPTGLASPDAAGSPAAPGPSASAVEPTGGAGQGAVLGWSVAAVAVIALLLGALLRRRHRAD